MRLVHTVERYAPAIGGAERVVQRVSEGLVARGHEVVVITSGRRSSERLNGVTVERFPLSGNNARGIRGDAGSVYELVGELAPDILFNYAAQAWPTDLFVPPTNQPPAYRHVLAPCGFSALHDPGYAEYFAKMREWLPRYDALLFHSAVYRDWDFAVAAGTAPESMHVIPNGADDPVLRRPVDHSEARFATVSSHVRSKGHGDFVAAVRGIARKTAASGVVVAPQRRGLDFARGCQPRCSFESLRGGGIRFVDGREPGIVARVLAEVDIFLFPSQIECAPLVILEAMASGVPWISYDVGNVHDLAGGIIVGGFDELVQTAERLAHLPHERAELADAGQSAWRARHRWPAIVDEYEQLFLRLTTADGAAARVS